MSVLEKNLSLLVERGVLVPREIIQASPTSVEPDALDEWFEELDLEGVDLLFLFGVGDGSVYLRLREWLHADPGRYLVFLDLDLGAIHSWLQTEEATLPLSDQQVKIFLCQDEKRRRATFLWCYTYFAGLASRVVALPSHARRYPALLAELSDRFGTQSFDTSVILQELFRNCAASFANFYANLQHLHTSHWANRLYNRFEGVPAIICGAGPSLAKNCEQLRELRDRALLFAPGSAMNALTDRGIEPHFGVGIDPNPEQLERMEGHSGFQMATFYANRWCEGILPMVHGPRLFVSGMGMHRFDSWIEEELGIGVDESLNAGHTGTHLALELARRMGCNPVILVGQDLAYSEGRVYDSSVEALATLTPEEIEQTGVFHEKPIVRQDVEGNEVYTAWKWVLEARWVARFAKQFPNLRVVNATEGGLEIEGIEHLPLSRVKLERNFALDERVAAEIDRARFPSSVTQASVEELVDRFSKSLDRSEPLAKELVEELEALAERATLPPSLRSGRAALLESDLRDELPYELIFEILLAHCSTTLYRHLERLRRLPEEKAMRERLEIDLTKARFVSEGICLHRRLIGRRS